MYLRSASRYRLGTLCRRIVSKKRYNTGVLEPPRNRTRYGLAGLVLAGLTFTCLAPLLLAWGYHLSSDYDLIGSFFLALNAGLLVGVPLSHPLLKRASIGRVLLGAAALGAVGYAGLVFAGPPVAPGWRHGWLLALGISSGALNVVLFGFLAPAYHRAPTATVNLGGVAFLLGAILGSQSVAGSLEGYDPWLPVAGFAALYLIFGIAVWRARIEERAVIQPISAAALRHFRHPQAMLFASVLFFHFGAEISVASWLPLMLVQRVGMSPASALRLLTLYWLTLLVGRALVQSVRGRVRHRHLLASGALSAMFGCLILAVTNNRFGSVMAILFAGAGFAVVYPVLVEMVGNGFRYYHPVYFHGVFSIALSGGLLAPWIFGVTASGLGIGGAMLIPLGGTLVVTLLLVVMWIGRRANRAVV